MARLPPKNIVIVGGSLGGLLLGVALKQLRRNLNIRILERNPTPLLHDQGAGVVAGGDVQDFFQQHDRTNTPLAVPSHQRLYLDKKGDIINREDKQQHMTSWGLLYHVLRANFDGVDTEYVKAPASQDNEGTAVYSYGHQVDTIDTGTADGKPLIHTTTADGPATFTADLLVGADGPSSTVRKLLDPAVKRTYAGYVAWRGTVPENDVSASARDVLVEKFPFFHGDGTQLLAYTIPGPNGAVAPGKRLLNWVWYVNYAEGEPEHAELMTDAEGKKHHITLPPGGIQEHVWAAQKAQARRDLPPQFAELVERTEVPFVQGITDVLSSKAVLWPGAQVVLVGDALAGFRPHTAASTNQAAWDAMVFAEAVGRVVDGEDKEKVMGEGAGVCEEGREEWCGDGGEESVWGASA